jgi:hypothetical protein
VSSAININPFDVGQSAYAAGWLLGAAYKRYGDLNKAIAAYNWGSGNLDADIAKHGKNWMDYAPKETQNEIARVLKNMGISGAPSLSVGSPNAPSAAPAPDKSAALLARLVRQGIVKPAHVTITNSTSARVAVSANAAAHG